MACAARARRRVSALADGARGLFAARLAAFSREDDESLPVSMAVDEAMDRVFLFFETLGRPLRPAVCALREALRPAWAALRPGLCALREALRPAWAALRPALERAGAFSSAALASAGPKAADLSHRALAACVGAPRVAGNGLARAGRAVAAFMLLYRRQLIASFACCTAAALFLAAAVSHYTGYAYMYNGKQLGFVKDRAVVYGTVGLVGEKLSEAYGAEIGIDADRDISFSRIVISGEAMDSREDVLNRLTYMKDMKVRGYVIVADGKRLAILDSEAAAKDLLERVKQQFMGDGGAGYLGSGFAESVEIKAVDTKLARLEKPDEVFDYVMTGAVEQRIHPVEKGETLSGIAQVYGMRTADLMALNPEVVPERMQIGQEIKLERVVPLLTVETTEVATYAEPVPFDIVYENTSAMFQGEQTIKLAGVNGERLVTAEITKQNGVETSKTELSSSAISAPSTQIMLVGTKEVPPLIGLGYFEYPTRGKLSSRFGTRWGRMHTGIDLAASTGTPIRAADGGKVIFAGWNGAYGYSVTIDHGGNRTTLYGHCSKLLVSVGDSVYQGQHIANVGNTGRSTGPHLHFEIRVNGVPKNPLNYL
jgi:murein DD-endopeptidase MepM/ murein hydrolase activator NlpD